VTYDKDLMEVRAWLLSIKGNWPAVAKKSKVSKRAISYIANDPDTTPTPATVHLLKLAKQKMEKGEK